MIRGGEKALHRKGKQQIRGPRAEAGETLATGALRHPPQSWLNGDASESPEEGIYYDPDGGPLMLDRTAEARLGSAGEIESGNEHTRTPPPDNNYR